MSRKAIIQIIIWALLAGIIFGFTIVMVPVSKAILNVSIHLATGLALFYLTVLWGFDAFYKEHRIGRYVLYSLVLILVFSIILAWADFQIIRPNIMQKVRFTRPFGFMFLRSFFWILLFQLGGTIYMLQNRVQQKALHARIMAEEKLQTELKLLKAQINPHFLFNALNNIYSLAYLKSDLAPDSILKLSNMLRYVIEECREELVTMDREIDYINHYLAFLTMKSPEKKNIGFQHNGLDLTIRIPPLLLIPFIENAWKYSRIEEDPNGWIRIRLSGDRENLVFTIANSWDSTRQVRAGTGSGIDNVRQRLQIIYPERHRLTITPEPSQFTVNLELSPA